MHRIRLCGLRLRVELRSCPMTTRHLIHERSLVIMSDRLLSQLSKRLELPESKTAPILKALLKQIRQRAEKKSGVTIPDLGTFAMDSDGNLQFDPAPALEEAANEAYAGLDQEPVVPTETPGDEASSNVPGSASESTSQSTSPSQEAGAAEPSGASPQASQSQRDDDATEEFTAPSPSSSQTSGASKKDEGADTGSLWPVQSASPRPVSSSQKTDSDDEAPASKAAADTDAVETTPTEPSSGASSSEQSEHPPDENLPDTDASDDDPLDDDFWSRDREWDLSSVAFGDEPDEDFSDTSEGEEAKTTGASASSASVADASFSDESPARASQETESASSSGAPSQSTRELDDPQDVASVESSADASPQSSKGRIAFVAVLLIAALIGGWIVLGERGTVPGPGAVVETLRTSLSSDADPAPATADADDAGDAETADEPSSPASTDSEDDGASPDTDEAPPSDPADETGQPAPDVDPSAGGWTLVVASRTEESEAEALQESYASSLQGTGLPVSILPSEGPDGTMRYRVVIGQFSSQEEAQETRELHSALMPDDAWSLQL